MHNSPVESAITNWSDTCSNSLCPSSARPASPRLGSLQHKASHQPNNVMVMAGILMPDYSTVQHHMLQHGVELLHKHSTQNISSLGYVQHKHPHYERHILAPYASAINSPDIPSPNHSTNNNTKAGARHGPLPPPYECKGGQHQLLYSSSFALETNCLQRSHVAILLQRWI